MNFSVRVRYSPHCYSEDSTGPQVAGSYILVDNGRQRIFSPDRYAYSLGLPGIINGLLGKPTTTVSLTHEQNFTMSLTTMQPGLPAGSKYYIFFRVKPSKPGLVGTDPHEIDLYVESAYPRDKPVAFKSRFPFGRVAEKVALGLVF